MSLIAPGREHVRPNHLGEPYDRGAIELVAAVIVLVVTVAVVLAWSVHTPVDVSDVKAANLAPAVIPGELSTLPPLLPPSTLATAAPPPATSWSSTMYCEPGTTASGTAARLGVVAVSFADYPTLLGSRWRVISGPAAGQVVTAEDKGSLAHFDIWTASCAYANSYGVQPITAERLP